MQLLCDMDKKFIWLKSHLYDQ